MSPSFVPLLLIRVLQGLALGGEYGGAAVYVAEHVPDERRGFYTSFIQITATLGLFASLVVILLCAAGAAGIAQALDVDLEPYREARRVGALGSVAGRVIAEPTRPHPTISTNMPGVHSRAERPRECLPRPPAAP